MSVRLLREYLGYRPAYLSNTFVIGDENTIEKSNKTNSKKRGAYDEFAESFSSEVLDDSAESNSVDRGDMSAEDSGNVDYDSLPGDYPEESNKFGSFVELINGAYDDMGLNNVMVFGGNYPRRVRSTKSDHKFSSRKSASTVSADVYTLFKTTKYDKNNINNLLADIVQENDRGDRGQVAGAYELDSPDETDDIWGIIKGGFVGADDNSSVELIDENIAGLSIMGIISD